MNENRERRWYSYCVLIILYVYCFILKTNAVRADMLQELGRSTPHPSQQKQSHRHFMSRSSNRCRHKAFYNNTPPLDPPGVRSFRTKTISYNNHFVQRRPFRTITQESLRTRIFVRSGTWIFTYTRRGVISYKDFV